MPKFIEMDDKVTLFTQMEEEVGPVILINKFNVVPEEAEQLLQAWAEDVASPHLFTKVAVPGICIA